MNDTISRQAAIDAIDRYYKDKRYITRSRTILSAICRDMKSTMDSLPSAQPVRHGRWIRDEFGAKCGACGLYAYRDKFDQPWESPYCPNCGAKMRGEKE